MAEGADDETLVTLPDPPELPKRRGSDLVAGIGLLPEQRLRAFSDLQLELAVSHWQRHALEPRYARVRHVAGSGDKGRDVVGFVSEADDDPWDNYQCKQYDRKLAPADIWPEICKLVFYASRGDYSVPRAYRFVAPLGVGAKGRELLGDSEAIRNGLSSKWATHGASLCSFAEIEERIRTFEFPDFDVVAGGEMVEDLEGSAIYPVLFGGGLTKARPPVKSPPEDIAEHEVPYIRSLVDAYDDHCDAAIASANDALTHGTYGAHLRLSRRDFYCAESLREFSKDVLVEPDNFEGLQEEIFDGVAYTLAKDQPSGYERVVEVCEHATGVQISDHPLRSELAPSDRSGICHQLANDGRVSWTR